MTKSWYDNVVKYHFSQGLLVSDVWRDIVTNFEGLKLYSYQDSVGVWTIGYGHTLGAKPGQVITEERAEELLFKDVQRFESSVNRLIEVPLTQYQFDALVSFAFNVGGHALKTSTLRKVLNKGDYEEASNQFLRWVYAGGNKLRGLERRRKAESALFKGQDWKDAS